MLAQTWGETFQDDHLQALEISQSQPTSAVVDVLGDDTKKDDVKSVPAS